MSQSLAKNYVHIIFSTRNHQKFIFPEIEEELYRYMGGVCNVFKCYPLAIGGYRDHVYILCVLSKNMLLAKLVEKIKSRSSKWMKSKDDRLKDFYWQNGYGAFSISVNHVEVVKNYILTQHDRHKKLTFKEEYRRILTKHNIEINERYVWD